MPQRVRIADRFTRQSAEQLITMAGAVITGLTNNPAFPAPTVDLKGVQTAADELNAAMAAQAHAGTAETAEKKNKQEALIVLLRKAKHYVEDNCGDDLAVLLSSGFQAAAMTRARTPLGNPSILGVDLGNSTELVLKVTPIANAKCYEVRSAAHGIRSPGIPDDPSRSRRNLIATPRPAFCMSPVVAKPPGVTPPSTIAARAVSGVLPLCSLVEGGHGDVNLAGDQRTVAEGVGNGGRA